MAPDNEIQKVRKVAEDVMTGHSKVLKDPKPTVTIQKMGDAMVTLSIRPFTLSTDYWDVYFELQEHLKSAFEKNDIAPPIPKQIQIKM